MENLEQEMTAGDKVLYGIGVVMALVGSAGLGLILWASQQPIN